MRYPAPCAVQRDLPISAVYQDTPRETPDFLMDPCVFFFFNDTATTEIYTTANTLSLHDALPISGRIADDGPYDRAGAGSRPRRSEEHTSELQSLAVISYAVFCLKKKKKL